MVALLFEFPKKYSRCFPTYDRDGIVYNERRETDTLYPFVTFTHLSSCTGVKRLFGWLVVWLVNDIMCESVILSLDPRFALGLGFLASSTSKVHSGLPHLVGRHCHSCSGFFW